MWPIPWCCRFCIVIIIKYMRLLMVDTWPLSFQSLFCVCVCVFFFRFPSPFLSLSFTFHIGRITVIISTQIYCIFGFSLENSIYFRILLATIQINQIAINFFRWLIMIVNKQATNMQVKFIFRLTSK